MRLPGALLLALPASALYSTQYTSQCARRSTVLMSGAAPKSTPIQRRQLGNSDIMVSTCCLGGMTWGQQNTEEDANAQLSLAFDYGVNFIDTAEVQGACWLV